MKKIVLILAILAMATGAFAQVGAWEPTNQITVTWNPVTTYSNGNPIVAPYSVAYKIYYRTEGSPPTITPPDLVLLGTTDTLEFVATFAQQGRYFVGIASILKDASGNIVTESANKAWSDDPAYVGNGTFGVVYQLAPALPTGLRRK